MRLFHVSDSAGIEVFEPRPSPSFFEAIRGDVVYAIEGRLLHHYLLPRECPRVGFYAGSDTSEEDVRRFLGDDDGGRIFRSDGDCEVSDFLGRYVLAIERGWIGRIKRETIYVYELPVAGFELLDACAGYYVAYGPVEPIGVEEIHDIWGALEARGDLTVRVVDRLGPLAEAVKGSTLQFSCIRMRNAR